MKNKHFFYLIFIAGLILSSCSKQSNSLDAIPEDAVLVASFDLKSIVKKAKLDDIKEMNFYQILSKELQNENPAVVEKIDEIIKNPLVTGVDFFSNSYFFIAAKNERETYYGFTIGLQNSDKFEEFITEFSSAVNKPADIEDVGDFKVYRQPERSTIIGWDEDKVLILSSKNKQFNGPDSDKQFKDYYRLLITQESSNSIIENESFADFNKNTKDISAWISMDIANKMGNQNEMQQMQQFIDPGMLKNSSISAHLEFNDGEIKFTYSGDFEDEIFEKFASESMIKEDFNTEVLKYLPKDEFAVLSFGILLDKYYESLKKMPQYGMMGGTIEQEFQKNLGLSINDVLTSFEGDFVISLSDIEMQTIETQVKQDVWVEGRYDNKGRWIPGRYEYRDTLMVKEQFMPIISLCTTLKDENIFTTVISKIPQDIVTTTTDYYEFDVQGIKIYAAYYDGVIVLTNGINIITKAKSGGYDSESLAKSDLAADIENTYSFLYLNLDYESYPIVAKTKLEENMGMKSNLFKSIISIYDNAKFKATDFKNAEFTIELKTDEENSLYTIINSFDENINELMEL